MDGKMQRGYLVLADITGYTSYLAGVELDHAHEILTDLLETIVSRFSSLLTISKLEGDAVFGYTPEARVARGETLLELVESTYVAFRDRVEGIRRRTTCECRACRTIPSLDLKFLIHHGDFIVQQVTGIKELVGSDVNLIHRLLKNHVSEATGWKAYVLLTAAALKRLGLEPDGLHAQPEAYEHLGEVQTYSLDLSARYKALTDARRVFVSPDEAFTSYSIDIPAPPPVVWEWLNDPVKRAQYTFDRGLMFKAIHRPGGRTGTGARTHCVHGKKVAMNEVVLDWRPFEYLTVEQTFWGTTMLMTCELVPIPEGTRLNTYISGRAPAPALINRPVFTFMATRIFPMAKLHSQMCQLITQSETEPAAA